MTITSAEGCGFLSIIRRRTTSLRLEMLQQPAAQNDWQGRWKCQVPLVSRGAVAHQPSSPRQHLFPTIRTYPHDRAKQQRNASPWNRVTPDFVKAQRNGASKVIRTEQVHRKGANYFILRPKNTSVEGHEARLRPIMKRTKVNQM